MTDTQARWSDACKDDEVFKALFQAQLPALKETLSHELNWYIGNGSVDEGDLNEQEILDNLYITAWEHRDRKPAGMHPDAWLKGLLARVVWQEVRKVQAEKRNVSLEKVIPDDSFIYDDDESFWEWYQPDDVEKLEDELAMNQPPVEDVVAAMERNQLAAPERLALALHDIYQLVLQDVAATMRRDLIEVHRFVRTAREKLGL